MLLRDQLERIAIVLVRARNPNNIGAVARAMHDFGFRDLRLVNEFTVPLEAARSAVDASAVLHAASEFPTVAAAVADCTLVFGTTAVGERELQHPLATLAEAAGTIVGEVAREGGAQAEGGTKTESGTQAEGGTQTDSGTQAESGARAEGGTHTENRTGGRVALLFGSEKTGLSNEELSHCDALLTIPMHVYEDQRHPSMNLGQAVAVCLYELVREREIRHVGRGAAKVDAATLERLTKLWEETLAESEYTRHHPANTDAADVRRLVHRMQVDATDAPVWMGILRQILWKLRARP